MAITSKSTLKEVLADDRAVALVNEYIPGFMDMSDQFGPALGMKMSTLLKFPTVGIPKEKVKELSDKLDSLDA